MTFVAGLPFASLIFDTFGDQYGHRVAVIPAICMVFVPGRVWLIIPNPR
jgi:MFS family permease